MIFPKTPSWKVVQKKFNFILILQNKWMKNHALNNTVERFVIQHLCTRLFLCLCLIVCPVDFYSTIKTYHKCPFFCQVFFKPSSLCNVTVRSFIHSFIISTIIYRILWINRCSKGYKKGQNTWLSSMFVGFLDHQE